MRKLILAILLCSVSFAWSQVDARKVQKEGRWVVGGGLNLGFYNGFNIQAYPEVGYRIKKVEFGAVTGISYNTYTGDYYANYKSTLWNVGPYFVFTPVPQFYLRGQYQYYEGTWNWKDDIYNDYKYSENAIWLGGGYQSMMAPHVYFRIGLMYNVLYDADKSIFASGFLPYFGISAGL